MKIEAEDSAGCAVLRPKLSWTVEPQGSVTFRNPRRLKVNATAVEGPIHFVARSGDLYAETSIEVVSQERFRTLLAATPTASGDAQEVAVAATAPQIAAGLAVAEDRGKQRKTWFAVFAGGVSAFLGGFGVWLVRQGRKARAHRRERRLNDDGVAPRTQKSPALVGGKKVCPRCGAKYDGALQFCGHDGTALVSN
jgi:hypothetical protein